MARKAGKSPNAKARGVSKSPSPRANKKTAKAKTKSTPAKKSAPRKAAAGTGATPRALVAAAAPAAVQTLTGTIFLDPSGQPQTASLVLANGQQFLLTCGADCQLSGFQSAFNRFMNVPPGQPVTVTGSFGNCFNRTVLHI